MSELYSLRPDLSFYPNFVDRIVKNIIQKKIPNFISLESMNNIAGNVVELKLNARKLLYDLYKNNMKNT